MKQVPNGKKKGTIEMLKQNIEKAKDLLKQIVTIKQNLSSECEKIDSQYDIYSSEYRLSKKKELDIAAMEKIFKLADEAETIIEKIGEEVKAVAEDFDYSDPKLVAAVAFISASKGNIPVEAGKKMVDDFKGKPAVLKYLAGIFEENGCLDCALYAQETERDANIYLPSANRLSDMLYYLVNSSSSTYKDFTEIIDQLERYEALSATDSEPAEEPEPQPDPEPDPEPETDPEPEG